MKYAYSPARVLQPNPGICNAFFHRWMLAPVLAAVTVLATSCAAPRAEDRLESVLWYQHAAEARALYYQAYNVACDRLQEIIDQKTAGTKPAVIVDIDETVLNNSAYEAGLIRKHQDFTMASWDVWTKECKAERLPGAVDFLNFGR